MKPLLIRADASTEIGTGHIMRCLSLGQAYRDRGGEVHFLTSQDSSLLDDRIEQEGFSVRHLTNELATAADAEETTTALREIGASWIVVDGYQFSSAYQCSLKDTGARILFFDDYGHCDQYSADLVLNQNITADASLYPDVSPDTTLLLGTDFILLRQEFSRSEHDHYHVRDDANRVLITLGGADPHNVSQTILEALSFLHIEALEIQLIIGAANPHRDALAQLGDSASCQVEILSNVQDMQQRMLWADIAIAAAGTTTWELLYLGVPFITGYFAENQMAIAQKIAAMQLAQSIDSYTDVSVEQLQNTFLTLYSDKDMREQYSCAGQAIVDGKGAERIVDYLSQ